MHGVYGHKLGQILCKSIPAWEKYRRRCPWTNCICGMCVVNFLCYIQHYLALFTGCVCSTLSSQPTESNSQGCKAMQYIN